MKFFQIHQCCLKEVCNYVKNLIYIIQDTYLQDYKLYSSENKASIPTSDAPFVCP